MECVPFGEWPEREFQGGYGSRDVSDLRGDNEPPDPRHPVWNGEALRNALSQQTKPHSM